MAGPAISRNGPTRCSISHSTAARQHRSRTAFALRRDRRRQIRHHRSGAAGALSGRDAQPVRGPHADGAAAGLGRRSVGDPQTRQRDQDRDRAAGRQYRAGRRPDSAPQRDRPFAQPARPHPRGRLRPRTPSPARPASPCSVRAKPPPRPTGFIRSSCPPRAPAPSAATSPPMPAARRRWPTASRARMRSASKWCWPTAACSTISTS